jgi:hypothetical protein
MLLDGERPRVKRDAEDLDARDEPRPGAADGEGEQLRDEAGDGDGRVSEEEELVQAWDDDRCLALRRAVFLPVEGEDAPKTMPMSQVRSVLQGMSGSSVFATAERTSGYGESSSSAATSSLPFGSWHSSERKEGRGSRAQTDVKVGDRVSLLIRGARSLLLEVFLVGIGDGGGRALSGLDRHGGREGGGGWTVGRAGERFSMRSSAARVHRRLLEEPVRLCVRAGMYPDPSAKRERRRCRTFELV